MLADRLKNKYVLLVGLLFLLSLYIAVTRIYQVDEAENVYASWLLGSGRYGSYDLYTPIYLFGLQFITRLGGSAESMYLSARLVWVPVFWAILVLIALCTGSTWKEERFWKALAIAGFTAPIWTYGLEVRHDGPALVLMLGIWLLVNPRRKEPRAGHFFVGGLFALVYFCSAKHIVYLAPLVLLALLVPHPLGSSSGPRRWIHISLGAVSGISLFVLLHLAKGSLGKVLAEYRYFLVTAVHMDRFAPWALFRTIIQQSPFVIGLAILPAFLIRRDRLKTLMVNAWSNGVAELIFMGSVLFGVLLNPTPFPYNSLPFTAVALAVGLPPFLLWLEEQAPGNPGYAIGISLLLCTLCLPWTIQIQRLLEADNDRQVELMSLAEHFTSPGDRVFDAAGLVPGRESIQPTWYVTLGNAPHLRTDPARRYETLFRAHTPAVLIPTYRMGYLDADTQAFLKGHYVPLAEDFWVLGGVYPGPGGSWECLLQGRYWVSMPAADGSSLLIDGVPVQLGAHEFPKGIHAVSTPPGARAIIFWLGPKLSEPPLVGAGRPGVFPIPIQM